MSILVVRSRDSKILKCVHSAFVFGALESYAVFKTSKRLLENWPAKIFLIRSSDLTEVEGLQLVGKTFDASTVAPQYTFVDYEWNLPKTSVMLGVSSG